MAEDWVAERDEVLTSVEVNGRVLRLTRPVEARAGRQYVLRDLGDGTATLKRPWVTPAAVEHRDDVIRSGNAPGVEGSDLGGGLTGNGSSTPAS